MAELEIEGSFDEQWGMVKGAVRDHHASLYGNGQPGVVDFVSATKGQLRLLIILVTAFGVLCGTGMLVLGLLEYNRQSKSGLVENPPTVATLDATAGTTHF
jgi:hypothetical protein